MDPRKPSLKLLLNVITLQQNTKRSVNGPQKTKFETFGKRDYLTTERQKGRSWIPEIQCLARDKGPAWFSGP